MAEKCKRCLLYEMAGSKEVYESVLRLIADMDPSERASKEESTRRLGVCKACDHLLDGMCRACGCYVELRAAARAGHCPKKKW